MAYIPYDLSKPGGMTRMQGYAPAPVGQNVGGNPFAADPAITPPPDQGVYGQVWGLINPQLQAAADAINRRSQYGSSAITDLTNIYGQRMAAASGMDVFGPEKAPLRAAAQWGQSSLVGSGQQQAGSLAAAAKQAGPGLTAGRDLNLAQQGKGAGGAAYGTGISWLDAQVAKAAAAQTRAALEPSFAAGMGQMQQGILANQLARNLADQQSQIEGQIPQLVDTLTERAYAHSQDQRDYEEKVREFNLSAQLDTAKAKAASGTAADKAAYAYARDTATAFTKNSDHLYIPRKTKTGWEVFDAGSKTGGGTTKAMQHVTINGKAYTFNPNTGTYLDPKTGQPVTPTGKAGAPPKVNMPLSRARGEWVDASGNPIPGLAGTPPPFFKPGAAPGGAKPPTGNQLSNMIESWYTGKPSTTRVLQRDAKGNPITDKNGAPIYKVVQGPQTGQLSYQQAYQRLRALKVDDQQARQLLNTKYQRGERGRPWLGPNARQTLTKAGLRPAARYHFYAFDEKGKATKGIPYLLPAQVNALKAAGQLPPGAWANKDEVGHVYVIQAGY